MDTSFSRMHVISGLIAAATVAAIAIANPFTTLTQFSQYITFPSASKGAEQQVSRGVKSFARTQRNALNISILARNIKPKFTKRQQYQVPSPPRRGVPGGGS